MNRKLVGVVQGIALLVAIAVALMVIGRMDRPEDFTDDPAWDTEYYRSNEWR